ncbi:hypothetical protein BHM03_00017480 [Ensete ventricosum]|nr:hypothetical protein BHM03_00017480 [Ensete ventricosum]
MSTTNPHSPIADPLGTHHPDPKVQSRIKSTSSSEGQPRAVTSPRPARLMHDIRLGRGWRMTKTLTSYSSREARSTHAMMMHWVQTHDEEASNQQLRKNLDLLEEKQADAHMRTLAYRRVVAKLYNRRVCPRLVKMGDLVLWKAEVSDPIWSRGKLAPNWEGPH